MRFSFAMMNLGDGYAPTAKMDVAAFPLPARCAKLCAALASTLALLDSVVRCARWMLSRLNFAIETMSAAMEKCAHPCTLHEPSSVDAHSPYRCLTRCRYDFSTATTAVYSFWQYELCDVYIELVKPVMSAKDATAAEKRAMQDALYTALEQGLRQLHPFMPFVTEELWQRLPRVPGVTEGVPSIMLAPYPTPVAAWTDASVETDMELVNTVVKSVRSLRAAYGLVRVLLHVWLCSAGARLTNCVHSLL